MLLFPLQVSDIENKLAALSAAGSKKKVGLSETSADVDFTLMVLRKNVNPESAR